ncbi:uncharacterized protein [Tiliqua scincoides]|uniref:uncharacterized protein n=1 Tax=Tiliqua scincoides TaxID=71010 RepID=UPI0034618F47
MAWVLLLLTLVSHSSGVWSQPTITQPASMSVSVGQTVKLTCSRSSSGSWEPYYRWYQQSPGEGPRFVHCNDACSRGEGIPDRFTASASGTTGYLTITNVQPQDEADYYCANWYGTGSISRGTGIPDRFTATASGNVGYLTITNIQAEDEADYHCALYENTSWRKLHRVRPQATVTQPASESASLGQTAKLSCSRSSGGSWGSFYFYQQKPGQAPRYVHCSGCSSRGEGIPDRFTASASGDVGYLTINSIQAEDEADYYCALWHNTGSVSHSDTN